MLHAGSVIDCWKYKRTTWKDHAFPSSIQGDSLIVLGYSTKLFVYEQVEALPKGAGWKWGWPVSPSLPEIIGPCWCVHLFGYWTSYFNCTANLTQSGRREISVWCVDKRNANPLASSSFCHSLVFPQRFLVGIMPFRSGGNCGTVLADSVAKRGGTGSAPLGPHEV